MDHFLIVGLLFNHFFSSELGDFAFPDNDFQNISEDAKNLIRQMLVVNPSHRITIEQLWKNPWIHQDIEKIPETPLKLNVQFDFNTTLNPQLGAERINADNLNNYGGDAQPMKMPTAAEIRARKNKKRKPTTSTNDSDSNITGLVKNITDKLYKPFK